MIRTEQFLDGSTLCSFVQELNWSMNASKCPHLSKGGLQICTKFKQGSIRVHVCKWKIGSRWQTWILFCLCAHVANKGSQCTVTTWYSKVMSANSYAEKGVLNEVIQNELDLVQDHVPGQVFEVVELFVALSIISRF